MGRRLSLVGALTAEQLAERDLAMIASAASEPLQLQLIKAIFCDLRALKAEVAKLQAQPARLPDELVDAKYIAKRFGFSSPNGALGIMRTIGCIGVGEKYGRKRCRLADVDRYANDPANYERRVA
jgi:hypothetical protein